MAESTSNLDFYDLLLRVAKAAGCAYYGSDGSERAMIPTNNHDFERCKDVVNDGIKMFISDAPPEGWRWQNRIMEVTFGTVETTGTVDSGDSTSLIDDALADVYDTDDEIVGYYIYDKTKEIYAAITAYTASTGDITVAAWLDYDDEVSTLTPAANDSYSITDVQTVDGDKARYPLSQDFMGEYTGKITYAANSNRGHIIQWASENLIRTKREVSVSNSHPTHAAVRPWRNRRWELIVDPSPSTGDTIVFPYKVGFDALDMIVDTASGGADTSLTDSGLANLYPTDYFKGWYVYIISGTGKTSYAKCTGYASATGVFSVADWLFSDGTAAGQNPGANSVYYVAPANNKHPAGMQFDSVIVAACLAQAEMEFDDLGMGYVDKYLKKDLPAAYRIDIRSAPKKLGKMLSGTSRVGVYEHIRNDVTTDNDM